MCPLECPPSCMQAPFPRSSQSLLHSCHSPPGPYYPLSSPCWALLSRSSRLSPSSPSKDPVPHPRSFQAPKWNAARSPLICLRANAPCRDPSVLRSTPREDPAPHFLAPMPSSVLGGGQEERTGQLCVCVGGKIRICCQIQIFGVTDSSSWRET